MRQDEAAQCLRRPADGFGAALPVHRPAESPQEPRVQKVLVPAETVQLPAHTAPGAEAAVAGVTVKALTQQEKRSSEKIGDDEKFTSKGLTITNCWMIYNKLSKGKWIKVSLLLFFDHKNQKFSSPSIYSYLSGLY